MHITTMQQAEQALAVFIPAVSTFTGATVNLDRMWPLMAALGNPHQKLQVVHVAGTSGKTSTSYYCAALLKQAGLRVGLTVSPHIDSVTERIQINGAPITEEMFCKYVQDVLQKVTPLQVQPTYFELLMALAYYVFAKEKVDVAVIETGMGGLLDASNVATLPNKLCVITDIGFDHMHILGSTISQIAAQKAGIIHPHNAVFMYTQQPEVMQAIQTRTKVMQAQLYTLPPTTYLPIAANLPNFQQRNYTLACRAVSFLLQHSGHAPLTTKQQQAALTTYIPGRIEVLHAGNKTVVMDGAHNAQKMQALVSSFTQTYPSANVQVLLAMKQGKEYQDVLRLLQPITAHLTVTSFATTQDLPAHAMDPMALAQEAKKIGFTQVSVEPDAYIAYTKSLQSGQDTVLITGSFYLLAQLRSMFSGI